MKTSLSLGWPRIVAALGVMIVASGGHARADQGGVRTYVTDIDGTVATATAGQLGAYAGDSDATVNLTLTNTSAEKSLGSANLTVPSPLKVRAVDGVPYAGTSPLQLRSIGLAPGASRVYVLTMDITTCFSPAAKVFGIAAKESADYTGTGNSFALVSASSDLLLHIVGSCLPAFVAQPASAERTKAITSVAFTPGSAPISVELLDAGGTGRVSFSGTVVTLKASRPGVSPAPGLGGTTNKATVSGLASFAPGPSLSISAQNYRFTASSTTFAATTVSEPFDIFDKRANCISGVDCSASSTGGGQSVTANMSAGTSAGNLLLSVGPGDAPAFECPGYPRSGKVISQYFYTGGDERVVVFTTQLVGDSRPLSDYKVCWAAPYEFTTFDGTPAVIQGVKPGTSDPLWVGLLPDCPSSSPWSGSGTPSSIPCVSARTQHPVTKVVTLSVLADSRDPWRY